MHAQPLMGRQAVSGFFVVIFSILMCLMRGGSVAAQDGCGNTMFTNKPTNITGPCCQTVSYDFNAQDMEGDT